MRALLRTHASTALACAFVFLVACGAPRAGGGGDDGTGAPAVKRPHDDDRIMRLVPQR